MVKDAVWRVRGRVFERPAPLRARSILFVCLGNICRSPFAGERASQEARRLGLSLTCASAGLSTRQAAAVPVHGVAAATAYGVSLADHRPVQLTAAVAADQDVIAVMEPGQLAQVRMACPEWTGRLILLPLFDPAPSGAYERCHIDDPFAQPRAVFEYCYDRIDRCIVALLDDLDRHSPD